ncbi:MAG: hypothetical protein IPQ23_11360 [Cytophagaceae bacterium]|nr:hypothetical protein [Cytophagaceae bacterium]
MKRLSLEELKAQKLNSLQDLEKINGGNAGDCHALNQCLGNVTRSDQGDPNAGNALGQIIGCFIKYGW